MEGFVKFIPKKAKTKAEKKIAYHNTSKLYNELLNSYYDDYNIIIDEEKERMGKKCDPKN